MRQEGSRYSSAGVTRLGKGSSAARSGVPPLPQKPKETPSDLSLRTASWVIELPGPIRSSMVLAAGMLKLSGSWSSPRSLAYSSRPSRT